MSTIAFFRSFYGYSSLVHFENTPGLGEVPWADEALFWKIGDVFYASLDAAAVLGLWLKRPCVMSCFPRAAWAQMIPYFGFSFRFTLTEELHSAGLVILHISVLAGFLALILTKKEQHEALHRPSRKQKN